VLTVTVMFLISTGTDGVVNFVVDHEEGLDQRPPL